jgi:uncharacterized protein (DUF2062 family)
MKSAMARSPTLRAPVDVMSEPARTDPLPTSEATPEEAPTCAPATPPASSRFSARVKHLLVHNILHLDDTPHRIAWGVFWGFFIGATPTIGIQVLLYVIVASLVGANRVSGILPIWLSNPVTAIPLYYGEWYVGRFLLTGATSMRDEKWTAIADAIMPRAGTSWWDRFFEFDLWITLFQSFVAMGKELWLGAVIAGVLAGALGYWFTYRAVIELRKRHLHP